MPADVLSLFTLSSNVSLLCNKIVESAHTIPSDAEMYCMAIALDMLESGRRGCTRSSEWSRISRTVNPQALGQIEPRLPVHLEPALLSHDCEGSTQAILKLEEAAPTLNRLDCTAVQYHRISHGHLKDLDDI